MKKIIDLMPYERDLITLERAHYEVQARENILNFMVINNMLNTEQYNDYYEDYIIYLKIYEEMKQDFSDNIIKAFIETNTNQNYKWAINFKKREAVIYEEV